jgi:hypothetical protein
MREELRGIQEREGLTDTEMALRLGCSRPLWNLIKNDRRAVSDATAIAAARAWPELTRALLERTAAPVKSLTAQDKSRAA